MTESLTARLPAEGSFGRWAKRVLDASPQGSAVHFVGHLSSTAYAFTKEQSCTVI